MSSTLPPTTEKIELFKVFMSPDVVQPMTETLLSGYIAQGPQNDKYENALKTFYGNDRIATVNAATSGLHLALRLLRKEIEQNDHYYDRINVLSCPQTCTATNFPIPENGYGIKWVDIDPRTSNMNLDDLAEKLDNTTRVIMIVHWAGYPVDLNKLRAIQAYAQFKFGYTPWIIQDCAHAFGMTFNAKYPANCDLQDRNICVYSTQAIKHLTTGDGGFMILPTQQLYERAKLLRWYGISREAPKNTKDYRIERDVPEYGYKFHMNDINATIGLANLPYIQEHIERARTIARYYLDNIKTTEQVIQLDFEEHCNEAAWWIYTLRVPEKYKFIEYMLERGIVASQVHKRNDGHSCLQKWASPLPILDWFERELVCIPIGWWITDDQMKYIVECVNEFTAHCVTLNSVREFTSEKSIYNSLSKMIQPLRNAETAETVQNAQTVKRI